MKDEHVKDAVQDWGLKVLISPIAIFRR